MRARRLDWKRTRFWVGIPLLVAVPLLWLSGCMWPRSPWLTPEEANPTTVLPPAIGTLEGFVTEHLSGEPVIGTRVVAYPLGGAIPIAGTTTNKHGFFRLVVPEGLYTVEARRDGFATSRVEGVEVASTTRIHIVQKPVASPVWSLEPPAVTITGVAEGDTVIGPISVRVQAEGPNHIMIIYAAFGKMPGAAFLTAPRAVFPDTHDTGTFTIDPATYGVAGATTFEVVVYDWNDNRTHIIYRVHVTPGAVGPVSPPMAPIANILVDPVVGVLIPPRTALAVTLSKELPFLGVPVDPTAAPPGSNLYVELRWRRSLADLPPVVGDGYRIYRRLDHEAEFRLLYTVNATGAMTYIYRDSTPDLFVGLTAHYRITYFRGTAESAPLEASATPLRPWDVALVSPVDEAAGVSLTPTFTWAPTTVVGTTQFYQLAFWDFPHGDTAGIVIRTLNVTSATFTGIPGGAFERLQPHRMYHWEMRAALGIDLAANAVSVATNSGYTFVFPWQNPWEMFTFTTGDW